MTVDTDFLGEDETQVEAEKLKKLHEVVQLLTEVYPLGHPHAHKIVQAFNFSGGIGNEFVFNCVFGALNSKGVFDFNTQFIEQNIGKIIRLYKLKIRLPDEDDIQYVVRAQRICENSGIEFYGNSGMMPTEFLLAEIQAKTAIGCQFVSDYFAEIQKG